MVKILSQAGNSLADIYDVKGSIAGIEELETRELGIIHEMGGSVFSERMGGAISRLSTTALAQNITWDLSFTVPANVVRLLGVSILTDDPTRLGHATLSIRDPSRERELPILAWDSNEKTIAVRIQENGGAIGVLFILHSENTGGALPSFLLGSEQPDPMEELVFRGLTSGFGAGTVETFGLLYTAFPQGGGLSSRGVPVPSW